MNDFALGQSNHRLFVSLTFGFQLSQPKHRSYVVMNQFDAAAGSGARFSCLMTILLCEIPSNSRSRSRVLRSAPMPIAGLAERQRRCLAELSHRRLSHADDEWSGSGRACGIDDVRCRPFWSPVIPAPYANAPRRPASSLSKSRSAELPDRLHSRCARPRLSRVARPGDTRKPASRRETGTPLRLNPG